MGTPLWKDRELPHLRPTAAEAAALMSFRPDLVFHGRAGQQFLAIGNAVPPLLAAHIAAAGLGLDIGEVLAGRAQRPAA